MAGTGVAISTASSPVPARIQENAQQAE